MARDNSFFPAFFNISFHFVLPKIGTMVSHEMSLALVKIIWYMTSSSICCVCGERQPEDLTQPPSCFASPLSPFK